MKKKLNCMKTVLEVFAEIISLPRLADVVCEWVLLKFDAFNIRCTDGPYLYFLTKNELMLFEGKWSGVKPIGPTGSKRGHCYYCSKTSRKCRGFFCLWAFKTSPIQYDLIKGMSILVAGIFGH